MNLGNANEWNEFATRVNALWAMKGAGGNVQIRHADANTVVTMQDEAGQIPGLTIGEFSYLGRSIRDWSQPLGEEGEIPMVQPNYVRLYDQWNGDISGPDHVYRFKLNWNVSFDIVSVELYGLSPPEWIVQLGGAEIYPDYPTKARHEWVGYVRGTQAEFPAAMGQYYTMAADGDPTTNGNIHRFTGNVFGQPDDDIFHWMDPPPALSATIPAASPATGAAAGPYLDTDLAITYAPPLSLWHGGSPTNLGTRLNAEYLDVLAENFTARRDHVFYLAADALGHDTLARGETWSGAHTMVAGTDYDSPPPTLETGWAVMVLRLRINGGSRIQTAAVMVPNIIARPGTEL